MSFELRYSDTGARAARADSVEHIEESATILMVGRPDLADLLHIVELDSDGAQVGAARSARGLVDFLPGE